MAPLSHRHQPSGGSACAGRAHASEARSADFWSATADAATATVYKPTARGVREVSLMSTQYAGAGSLTMVCAGQWNVSVGYEARTGDATGTWRFTAAGRPFRILYEDCLDGRDESEPTPAWSDCSEASAFYHADGIMPAASGKQRTFVHLETTGMTRDQIITLVRSLRPVG